VRSARIAIAMTSLLLVLLPLVLLAVAWVYERAIVHMYEDTLAHVADDAAKVPPSEWPALAAKHGVWLRRLENGAVTADSQTASLATFNSTIGGAVEAALSVVDADTPFEPLAKVDAPLEGREELQRAATSGSATAARPTDSGQTVVVSVARRLDDGSVLLAERASHRGVRQLLLTRRQLGKLMLYQLFFAVAAGLVLARWLVRPLERLTARARAYPSQDLAEPALLQRPDEVGQLARAFTELTRQLEQRRLETVNLAADVAHELKNPLATISAASELVATTKDATPDKRARMHGVIVESVERLRHTTDGLLSLVRLEATLGQTPRDAIDYAAWLDALLDTYRSSPEHAGRSFDLDAQGCGTVHVAAEAWASLLRNLLDNAAVQPSPTRVIRVRARREGASLRTDVTDFGPGVSEGNRDKIFHRFFTARPEGAARGTGLGLALVSTIATSHGGAVELLPPVAGEGATFRVTIPALGAAATPLPHAVPEQSSLKPR
jgi:two-component system sensor histidine kinase ChvG